jgi:hypothetical protein
MQIPPVMPPLAVPLSPSLPAPPSQGRATAADPGNREAAAATIGAATGTGVAEGARPNPALRVDPELGLVVLEFRDVRGAARTIPTERELEAYRTAARGNGHPTGPYDTMEPTGTAATSGGAGGGEPGPSPSGSPAGGPTGRAVTAWADGGGASVGASGAAPTASVSPMSGTP